MLNPRLNLEGRRYSPRPSQGSLRLARTRPQPALREASTAVLDGQWGRRPSGVGLLRPAARAEAGQSVHRTAPLRDPPLMPAGAPPAAPRAAEQRTARAYPAAASSAPPAASSGPTPGGPPSPPPSGGPGNPLLSPDAAADGTFPRRAAECAPQPAHPSPEPGPFAAPSPPPSGTPLSPTPAADAALPTRSAEPPPRPPAAPRSAGCRLAAASPPPSTARPLSPHASASGALPAPAAPPGASPSPGHPAPAPPSQTPTPPGGGAPAGGLAAAADAGAVQRRGSVAAATDAQSAHAAPPPTPVAGSAHGGDAPARTAPEVQRTPDAAGRSPIARHPTSPSPRRPPPAPPAPAPPAPHPAQPPSAPPPAPAAGGAEGRGGAAAAGETPPAEGVPQAAQGGAEVSAGCPAPAAPGQALHLACCSPTRQAPSALLEHTLSEMASAVSGLAGQKGSPPAAEGCVRPCEGPKRSRSSSPAAVPPPACSGAEGGTCAAPGSADAATLTEHLGGEHLAARPDVAGINRGIMSNVFVGSREGSADGPDCYHMFEVTTGQTPGQGQHAAQLPPQSSQPAAALVSHQECKGQSAEGAQTRDTERELVSLLLISQRENSELRRMLQEREAGVPGARTQVASAPDGALTPRSPQPLWPALAAQQTPPPAAPGAAPCRGGPRFLNAATFSPRHFVACGEAACLEGSTAGVGASEGWARGPLCGSPGSGGSCDAPARSAGPPSAGRLAWRAPSLLCGGPASPGGPRTPPRGPPAAPPGQPPAAAWPPAVPPGQPQAAAWPPAAAQRQQVLQRLTPPRTSATTAAPPRSSGLSALRDHLQQQSVMRSR
eukprot:TRINITY_DN33630_c0_g1_i1.p1 TRINITY_DN33630_c0_g1~~TRINITY_DN33630_c0_g1_i1.p1  ORF type:complete len:832 (+),score=61.87 TRINITY_DN33630_c0_g1_i1:73-2568(+)